MINAVAYLRVSTKEQDEDNQRSELKKFAKRRDFHISEFFVDKGVSGTVAFNEREGSKALIEYVKVNKPKAVLVTEITRLGRSMWDTMIAFRELEENFGVMVVSSTESWTQMLDKAFRKLILMFVAWYAEREIEQRKERQRMAWEAGKTKGQPKKIPEDLLLKVLNKYPDASVKTIWAILRGEHKLNIHYETVRRAVKPYIKKRLEVPKK